MKKILLCTSILFTLISCNNKELEERVAALEKKFNHTNDSVKLINYSETLLNVNDKITIKDGDVDGYWDIPLDTIGNQKFIPFVYQRKNKSELWQPVMNVYFGEGYVRIPSAWGENDNQEVLIVNINYDVKKEKVVFE